MIDDLYVIRHAESEGNVAASDNHLFGASTEYAMKVRRRSHWLWRLSSCGVRQAIATGKWLGTQLTDPFVAATSPHLRAMETAGLLHVSGARWRIEPDLREREWGNWEQLCPAQRASEKKIHRDYLLLWRPPGGESLAMVARRVAPVLQATLTHPTARSAMLVTHLDTIWALRYLMEDLYELIWTDQVEIGTIANCEVMHYSRRNPYTCEVAKSFLWWRRACPWQEIPGHLQPLNINPGLSNEKILDRVRRTPPIDDDAYNCSCAVPCTEQFRHNTQR